MTLKMIFYVQSYYNQDFLILHATHY